MTKILVCTETFPGGVTAHKAAGLIADGLSSTSTAFEITQIPLAFDKLTVQTIVAVCGGEWRETVVLGEQGVAGRVPYGLLDGGRTAVVAPYRPQVRSTVSEETTSFGTGQLLKAVLQEKSVERIYFYLPEGPWTADAGVGCLQALGVSLLDPDGKSISLAGNNLARLTRVNFQGALPRLRQVELIVACDQMGALLGRQGAAWSWGSKMGMSFAAIEKMEKNFTVLAERIQRTHGGGHHLLSGTASGGGVAYGLALLGAKLKPQAEVLLENLDLLERVRNAHLVITGQALTDRQTTAQQLAPSVLRLCQETGTPGILLSGGVRPNELQTVFSSGAWAVLDAIPTVMSTTEMLEQVKDNLYFSAQQLGRLLLLGKKLDSLPL